MLRSAIRSSHQPIASSEHSEKLWMLTREVVVVGERLPLGQRHRAGRLRDLAVVEVVVAEERRGGDAVDAVVRRQVRQGGRHPVRHPAVAGADVEHLEVVDAAQAHLGVEVADLVDAVEQVAADRRPVAVGERPGAELAVLLEPLEQAEPVAGLDVEQREVHPRLGGVAQLAELPHVGVVAAEPGERQVALEEALAPLGVCGGRTRRGRRTLACSSTSFGLSRRSVSSAPGGSGTASLCETRA